MQKATLLNEVESLSEQIAALSTSLETADTDRGSHALTIEDLRSQLEAERASLASASSDASALVNVRAELGRATSSHEQAIKAQLERVSSLQRDHDEQVQALESAHGQKVSDLQAQISARPPPAGPGKKTAARIGELEKEVAEEKTKRAEQEKEHEDLLVLLEELSQKRRKDKVRMKEKGLEVSEGEEDDEAEGEVEEE